MLRRTGVSLYVVVPSLPKERAVHPRSTPATVIVQHFIATCEKCGLDVFHAVDTEAARLFPAFFPEGFTYVAATHHGPCGKLCVGGRLPGATVNAHGDGCGCKEG